MISWWKLKREFWDVLLRVKDRCNVQCLQCIQPINLMTNFQYSSKQNDSTSWLGLLKIIKSEHFWPAMPYLIMQIIAADSFLSFSFKLFSSPTKMQRVRAKTMLPNVNWKKVTKHIADLSYFISHYISIINTLLRFYPKTQAKHDLWRYMYTHSCTCKSTFVYYAHSHAHILASLCFPRICMLDICSFGNIFPLTVPSIS